MSWLKCFTERNDAGIAIHDHEVGTTQRKKQILRNVFSPLREPLMSSFCQLGTFLGNILCKPLSGFLCSKDGAGEWALVFYVFGAVGVLWYLLWYCFVYDSPKEHPRITKEEKRYIETSLGNMEQKVRFRGGETWSRRAEKRGAEGKVPGRRNMEQKVRFRGGETWSRSNQRECVHLATNDQWPRLAAATAQGTSDAHAASGQSLSSGVDLARRPVVCFVWSVIVATMSYGDHFDTDECGHLYQPLRILVNTTRFAFAGRTRTRRNDTWTTIGRPISSHTDKAVRLLCWTMTLGEHFTSYPTSRHNQSTTVGAVGTQSWWNLYTLFLGLPTYLDVILRYKILNVSGNNSFCRYSDQQPRGQICQECLKLRCPSCDCDWTHAATAATDRRKHWPHTTVIWGVFPRRESSRFQAE
uniref:Uncharacterized protein n=1 Tax=Timema cristinae TaxID=61476 RepID=A0A7R9CH95_TIMCR|nr:unnamed protein product [Timema cristinae]